MTCPSCEMKTHNTRSCDHCGADLTLYNKVHMMADRLYNKGLEQARGRSLSSAIETLTMCIHLQKNHITARNLLGLIYWEVGEVGQAIKQWTISTTYKKEENLANIYLKEIHDQPSKVGRQGDTMILFNKALHYIEQGSQDMAVINLRKAIAQNPNYIEAKALLSLYYITKEEENKAKELLEEIMQVTKDHPKANFYWNSLSKAGKIPAGVAAQEQQTAIPKLPAIPKVQPMGHRVTNTMIEPRPLKGNIIAFVIGIVCMVGVYTILITPSKTADLQEQIKLAQDKGNILEEKLEATVAAQAEEVKILEEQKLALEKANEALKAEQDLQEQQLNIQAARNLAQNKQWSEAATKLKSIDQDYLGEDLKAQYDALTMEVYPKAGEETYNRGYKEYQAKNYPLAIEILEKAFILAKEERFSDNILFIIGRSYEDQGNIEQAKQYYKSTIENYPGTDGASSAKRRLR